MAETERSRPKLSAPRRVMTAPHGLASSLPTPSSDQSAGGLVETLYSHPDVRIIAFTASGGGARSRSPGRALPDEKPGTLPWSSQLERTIAVGRFRIYRAPGSVAFLNCGTALQPILPKSQCWCIDEESSKFVLQIRRPQYWRIELPVAEPEDQTLAQALRTVMDQILQFEKTECPFKRSFTVQLPEKPATPVKKRPWTPARRSLPALSFLVQETSPSPEPKSSNNTRLSTGSRRSVESLKNTFAAAATTLQEEEKKTNAAPESRMTKDITPVDVHDSTPSHQNEQLPYDISIHESVNSQLNKVEEIGEDEIGLEDAPKSLDQPIDNNVRTPADTAKPEESSEIENEENNQTAAASHVETGREISIVKADDQQNPENLCDMPTLSESTASTAEEEEEQASPQQCSNDGRLAVEVVDGATETIQDEEEETPRAVVPSISFAGHWPGRESPSTPVEKRMTTPSKTDIFDVIRLYEQKSAAGTLTSLDVGSGSGFSTPPSNFSAIGTSPWNHDKDGQDDSAAEETTPAEQEDDIEVHEGSGVVGARRKKLRGFRAGRSLAVPPQLTLVTSPPSKSAVPRQRTVPEATMKKEHASPTGSPDSFHSIQSWHSPITPLPPSGTDSQPATPSMFPYPHDNITIPKRSSSHQREISDMTVTPDTGRRTWDAGSSEASASSKESTATAPDASPAGSPVAAMPPAKAKLLRATEEGVSTGIAKQRPSMRHRATTSSISVSRRALSPLPPAANLFSPTASSMRRKQTQGRLEMVRRIPMAIVAKTCEILLSPPSHLINLMLRVAARIAAGEWRGMVFGHGEAGETIPVQWDYSDGELSDWGDDDDFYMSQAGASRATSMADSGEEDRDLTGRSWEVD